MLHLNQLKITCVSFLQALGKNKICVCTDRVALPHGGYLVIEQTEALVSIGVNGGHGMFGKGASQEKAILDVNLSAAKQVRIEHELFFW